MNWSHMPYMRVSLVFIAGIWTTSYGLLSEIILPYTLWAVAGLYVLSERWPYGRYLPHKPAISGALLLFGFFLMGGFLFARQAEKMDDIRQWFTQTEIRTFTVTFHEEMKSRRGVKFLASLDYLEDTSVVDDNFNRPMILVQFSARDTLAGEYRPGDQILCRGTISNFRHNTNPEAFDYAQFMYYKGIVLQARIDLGAHLGISSDSLSWWTKCILLIKDYSQKTLNKYLEPSLEKGIVEALITGRRTHLDDQLYKTYADTGAVHVLAVSGLHVGIFISIFLGLFSFIKSRSVIFKWAKVVVLISLVILYVLITGASPSVVRAGVMISLFILGKTFFERGSTYNIMALAAIVMLMWNPFLLFQTSFQFSFLALLGILYFQPKIYGLYIPNHVIVRFVWGLISVSVAAQIFIFPFTVYYFHQFPVYFAVSSLLAVPLVTVIIYLGMLLMVTEAIWPLWNPFIADMLEVIVGILNACIQTIRSWPASVWEDIWLSDTSLMWSIGFFLVGILWWETRRSGIFYVALFCLLGLVTEISLGHLKSVFSQQITVYDTYDGTCVDIKNGREHLTYRIPGASLQAEEWAAGNLRIKNKFFPVKDITGGLVRVGQYLIYIYSDDDDFDRLRKDTPVNVLVVSPICKKDPEIILSALSPCTVILPAGIKPWLRKKWLNLPLNEDVAVYDVQSQGAFHMSLP